MTRPLAYFRMAFPDLTFTLDDLTGEHDKVFASWTMTGTHHGQFMAVAPTGKPITARGVTAYRLRDGKWVVAWGNWTSPGTPAARPPRWYSGDED